MTFGDVRRAHNWNETEMKLKWKRFYDAKSATWRTHAIYIATAVGWSVSVHRSFQFHFNCTCAYTRRIDRTSASTAAFICPNNILVLLYASGNFNVCNCLLLVRRQFVHLHATEFSWTSLRLALTKISQASCSGVVLIKVGRVEAVLCRPS